MRTIDITKKGFKRSKTPKLTEIRQLFLHDNESVQSLVTEATKRLFGFVDVTALLNNSFICLGLENERKDLAAAMICNNYPNIPSIPPCDWLSWVFNIYGIRQMSPRNALWTHLAVYMKEYSKSFLDKMLTDIFKRYSTVKYIVFITPPRIKFTSWLTANSIQIRPKDTAKCAQCQTLHVFPRQKYCPLYKMRAAVVEDNDDIVSLLDTHSKRLRRTYGNFYVAEILKIDPTRKIIVAEYNEETVAAICLNSVVNLELLREQFQVEPYNCLRVSHKDDIIQQSTLEEEDDNVSDILSTVTVKMSKETSVTSLKKCDLNEDKCNDLNAALDKISFGDSYVDLDSTDEDEEDVLDANSGKMFLGYANPRFSATPLTYSQDEQKLWDHYKKNRASDVYSATSSLTSVSSKPSIYFGDINCFCLELAAAKVNHELSLRKLLVAGFEVYPNRDYCVFSVPGTAPPFDLQTEVFVRVPPRPKSTFSSELYLVHRSALCGYISVREAEPLDITNVEQLLKTCKTGQTVLDQFLIVVANRTTYERQAFVVLCDSEVVGVAIVRDLNNAEYIFSHYNVYKFTDLSKHKPGCLGEMEYLTLSPIFLKHIRFVLLELYRLADYTFLCYKITRGADTTPLAASLCYMLPTMPLKVTELSTSEKPFACYISTPVYCGTGVIEVNEKIVVVGASSVALSFLVELAFRQQPATFVTYNNITLVSTHGLRICNECELRSAMMPSTSNIDSRYLSLISLNTYVNVIRGVMSGIDRKNKYVMINSSCIPYDILILTCGLQFLMPRREDRDRNIYENPNNVFIVNTDEDIDVAINKLERYRSRGYLGQVIVYGNTVKPYCTVEALIKMGFLPTDIVLVVPARKDTDHEFRTGFNDPDIALAVKAHVKKLGVKLYENFSFFGWKFDKKRYGIVSIQFQSLRGIMELQCLAVFMYDEKDISPRTFKAIHQAGLIYDGALVINPDFSTNDSNIYAAGTLTKYPRRYYADHMLHSFYDQSEIGRHLCRTIKKRLLSSRIRVGQEPVNMFDKCRPPGKMLVPRYSDPVHINAVLPANMNYFSIRPPGLITPYAIAVNEDNLGTIISTGNWAQLGEQGYFKLQLDKAHFVRSITCLSNSVIDSVGLTRFWGKHERLLDNLMMRYHKGMVKDLFEYFKKPSLAAICNNNFEELSKDVMETLISLTNNKGDSIIEDIVGMLESNKWAPLNEIQQARIFQRFMGSGYEKVIEEKVFQFLYENHTLLPMYANPTIYSVMVGNVQESPLFRPI